MEEKSKHDTQQKSVDIKKLIMSIEDFPDKVYANYAEFSMSNSEIFLDFYLINPEPGNQDLKIDPAIRVLIPPALIKGFVAGLANMVKRHEMNTGIEIPNSRTPTKDDVIEIW